MSEALEFDSAFTEIAARDIEPQSLERAGGNRRYEGDDNLFVRFFMHPHHNAEKSAAAGRPIYDDREYIEVIIPGDKSNTVYRPVRDMDRQRFAKRYQAFRAGAVQALSGTPLESWPGISRGQVEELKYFKIFTVEQLATLPDNLAQNFMGINALKDKAKAFLEASQGTAILDTLHAELEKKDAQISALTQGLNDLTEVVKSLKSSRSKASVAAAADEVIDRVKSLAEEDTVEEAAEDPEDR